MEGNKKSSKNLIIFWAMALLVLFGWYSYLMGNAANLPIILGVTAGMALGILVYPAAEFLSRRERAPRHRHEIIDFTHISDVAEQLAESANQAVKKTESNESAVMELPRVEMGKKDLRRVTPDEVKKRLSQLLRNDFSD